MKSWTALLFLLISPLLHAALQEREIDYRAGTMPLKGYLVWDDKIAGKRPGVLVVHEFWGLNDYARKRARMLAQLGYTALAVDMYGEGKAFDHPKDATEAMQLVIKNPDLGKERFLAAKTLLEQQPSVDTGKIAAIGYCFGGTTVLTMALAGVDLAGVVSFHGMLPEAKDIKPGSVKARVLVETGADDVMVTAANVEAFNKSLDSAGVKYHVDSYPAAKHGFTNPEADTNAKKFDLPIGYNADADKKSWAALQKFFGEIFKK
jgi:dienelactone hydrolase